MNLTFFSLFLTEGIEIIKNKKIIREFNQILLYTNMKYQWKYVTPVTH